MASEITLTTLQAAVCESATAPLPSTQVTAIESHWIRRAQQGDLAAFDWIISQYRERAVRLAAHVLRRPSEAEDIVQEAFLRAFAQIGTFRSDCSFYTWFYKIVVRLCLNRMRTPEWRNRSRCDQELDERRDRAHTPGPTETRAVVEMLLDQLSPPLRATLVLREVTGLDYEEIAVALSIPVGTVRSRLNAARYHFRLLWLQIQEETRNA